MKVVILAAGQGVRLKPLTDARPKCMVELYGKPLLHHQLATLEEGGVAKTDIALVAGYLQEAIVAPDIKQYRNHAYDATNMVFTLFAAEEFMQKGEDLIISYGDIVYSPEVFNKLLLTQGEIVIAADLDWYDLWEMRMPDPLLDAETFKMAEGGQILELGKKPRSKDDIQAQYIGLIKVSGEKVSDFIQHYKNMDSSISYDGKDYRNMYMTSFLQDLINHGWQAKAALINGGWLEVDSVSDLEAYQDLDGDIHNLSLAE